MWKWYRDKAGQKAEQEWQRTLPQPTPEQRSQSASEPSLWAVRLARMWPAANEYSGCCGDAVCETCLRVAKVIDVFGPQWTESFVWDLLNMDTKRARFDAKGLLSNARHRGDMYRHYLIHGRVYGAVNYLGGHGYLVPMKTAEAPPSA